MSYLIEVNRRGRYANNLPRQPRYPQWGMEEPRRVWNGHSLYRGGQRSLLDRYIIAPRGKRLRTYGVTVGDAIVCAGVACIMALLVQLVGIGFDGYLDSVGY